MTRFAWRMPDDEATVLTDAAIAGLVGQVCRLSMLGFPVGKAAGHIRNGWMLAYLLQSLDLGHAVGVLAFHDELERSKGTLSMVTMAEAAGVPVKRFAH